MRTRRMLSALAAAAALVIASCGSDPASDSDSSGESSGQSQLTFSGTTIKGEDFDAASLEGQPAVFWFWAPWCSTCAAQASDVVDLAERYDGQANVVGVASLGQPSEMEDFIERTGTARLTHINDVTGEIWQHFGITEQSTFAIVDADGVVTHAGYIEPDDLTDRVADLAA